MKLSEDRRAPNIPRVPIATLVDICTQKGDVSPFQVESANLSGRGMQVSTSYLPEIGEELICRFDQADQEILVEGRVAWRSEGADSGEFGIQFTALDADSAHVLQSLGEAEIQAQASSAREELDVVCEEEEFTEAEFAGLGSRVKLHIDGLGAPMKACVHQGSTRKLRVGSSLEFLKVGRTLEVEDVKSGGKRGAHVDTINVVINPTTSVPELVVQLRYEGITPTPAPAQVERGGQDHNDVLDSQGPQGDQEKKQTFEEPESENLSEDDPAPWEPAADALRSRLGGAMTSAGHAAQKASGLLGSVAQSARAQVSSTLSRRGENKNTRLRKQGGQSALADRQEQNASLRQQTPGVRRRQTSRRVSRSAPAHLRSGIHDAGMARRTRTPVPAKRSSAQPAPPVRTRRSLKPAALFGGACLVFGLSAMALRGSNAKTKAAVVQVNVQGQEAEGKKVATNTGASQASSAATPTVAKEPAPKEGVLAEVPLFGPQAMAVKPAETPLSEADEVKREKRAAAAAVLDETWEDEPKEEAVEKSTPWGRGRLYLPTIHRIRLDGAGSALSGAINQDGFTVVVSGRKAMESGKSIQKRDKRIMAVKTNNNAGGAAIRFEFRGPVPPYRVRLRKDFVEFLISAPEESIAKL